MARIAKSKRQDLILAELRINRRIRVADLAEKFGTSTETIRRDLEEMKAADLLNRTHGGATSLPLGHEPSVFERDQMFREERKRIGEKVVAALNPHDVVMMDAGTTTLEVAKAMSIRPLPLTVITNSYVAATVLGASPLIRVIMPPGEFSAAEAAVVGFETNEFVQRFNANTCIFGASGVTPAGPADTNLDAARFKRTMISRAHRAVLAVDHSKFERRALETVCPWSDVAVVVTDRMPAKPILDAFERHDVALLVAEDAAQAGTKADATPERAQAADAPATTSRKSAP
jgi:DeoR/GlpR family transcriptional regulator of sugar metabolism